MSIFLLAYIDVMLCYVMVVIPYVHIFIGLH